MSKLAIKIESPRHGDKIVAYFVSQGARPKSGMPKTLKSHWVGWYLFASGGLIHVAHSEEELPHWAIVSLLPEPKAFPRKMWVSNESDKDASKDRREREVLCRVTYGGYQAYVTPAKFGGFELWNFAVEIDQEIKEVTLEQISKKFNIPIDDLRIRL